MCSLPSVTCIKTAPIMTSSVAMYSRNRIPTIGAFITGDEDKYLFDILKGALLICPLSNSASFFNWSIRANALIFPDKLDINRLN
jgi:hypothetical protein